MNGIIFVGTSGAGNANTSITPVRPRLATGTTPGVGGEQYCGGFPAADERPTAQHTQHIRLGGQPRRAVTRA
jgi:hypothetical protein